MLSRALDVRTNLSTFISFNETPQSSPKLCFVLWRIPAAFPHNSLNFSRVEHLYKPFRSTSVWPASCHLLNKLFQSVLYFLLLFTLFFVCLYVFIHISFQYYPKRFYGEQKQSIQSLEKLANPHPLFFFYIHKLPHSARQLVSIIVQIKIICSPYFQMNKAIKSIPIQFLSQ